MFIIPSSDVLLLGTAITIVLAALQWFISGASLPNPRVQRLEDGGERRFGVQPGSIGWIAKDKAFRSTFSAWEA